MELKGIAFILLKEFAEKAFGPQGLERVLEKVSPETREVFLNPKKHKFYPWRAYVEFERALVDEFFGGDISGARKVGRFTAKLALKRDYRLVFARFKTPRDAVLRLTKLWGLYLRPGELQTQEVSKNYWTVRLLGFPITDMYAEHLSGWFETVLAHFGAKRARVSWEKEGENYVFHVMWEE